MTASSSKHVFYLLVFSIYEANYKQLITKAKVMFDAGAIGSDVLGRNFFFGGTNPACGFLKYFQK